MSEQTAPGQQATPLPPFTPRPPEDIYYFVSYTFEIGMAGSLRMNVLLHNLHPLEWASRLKPAPGYLNTTRIDFWTQVPAAVATLPQVRALLNTEEPYL